MGTQPLQLHAVALTTISVEYGWMKPYNPTVCTYRIRIVGCNYNFLQLVLGNWANFQFQMSVAIENQLHKIVTKCYFSSSVRFNIDTKRSRQEFMSKHV